VRLLPHFVSLHAGYDGETVHNAFFDRNVREEKP
jgi:hypothetical protein